jgi:hypothetical protein
MIVIYLLSLVAAAGSSVGKFEDEPCAYQRAICIIRVLFANRQARAQFT